MFKLTTEEPAPKHKRISLYRRLATTNLIKNSQIYLPFALMNIFLVAMFVMIRTIAIDPGMAKMSGGQTLKMLMAFGVGVMVIFSFILVFYTNGFLMKRRKKEIGIYNILGFSKRHIARMMTLETLIVALVCILLGLIFGTILMKLLYMLLLKLTGYPITLGLPISWRAMADTSLIFSAYFMVVTLYNLMHITLAKPIELVRGSSVGEQAPKSRWVLASLGAVALIASYGFAMRVENPLEAITFFFVAVAGVIFATYALFTTGSIVLLKFLRSRKGFYYRIENFTVVSGMLYRMKQHAMGLATLCILSTMVMISVSTTVSLYSGLEDSLVTMYPKELELSAFDAPAKSTDDLEGYLLAMAKAEGVTLREIQKSKYLSVMLAVDQEGGTIKRSDNFDGKSNVFLQLLDDPSLQLPENKQKLYDYQIYVNNHETRALLEAVAENGIVAIGQLAVPIEQVQVKNLSGQGDFSTAITSSIWLVFPPGPGQDQSMIDTYQQVQEDPFTGFTTNVMADIDGDANQKLSFSLKLREKPYEKDKLFVYPKSRSLMRKDFTDIYGGMLFLGIFLGTLFLAATVIIMYYKQITEGYEDQGRYETMQKVGMHHHEIKGAISTQTVIVFFLPLVVASIHLAFSFNIVRRMLALFGFNNIGIFVMCSVGTAVAFALVYLGFYRLTAKSYFKIVQWQA